VYKRVWIGGHNVTMMVAEMTWEPFVGVVGDGSLRRIGGGGIVLDW